MTKFNYQVIVANETFVVSADSSTDAMQTVDNLRSAEGQEWVRSNGSAKVSVKKANEAIANGARDLRNKKPEVATRANRQALGALLGM